MRIREFVLTAFLAATVAAGAAAQTPAAIPYDRLAQRIVSALHLTAGERVLLRYDPNDLGPLEPVLRQQLEAAGARVETLNYGPVADLQGHLDRTDVYVWLPAGPTATTPADQREILAKWLDAGRGRQIHFHWDGGSRDRDGLLAPHSAELDRRYVDALDIDYDKLSRDQDRVVAALRSGEVHVTTPAGTDLRFRVGDRPFNKQDGDASLARTKQARTRVDREIELPAGVLRVAPIETSVNGVLVVPAARLLDDARATDVRLEITAGKVVRATAGTGQAALDAFLASGASLRSFRELGIGLNPKLSVTDADAVLPYYGYGDAVVRLSLGDNTELAGDVRTGGGARWLFFSDTTLTAGSERIIENGRLTPKFR